MVNATRWFDACPSLKYTSSIELFTSPGKSSTHCSNTKSCALVQFNSLAVSVPRPNVVRFPMETVTTEEASTDSKATPAELSRCVFGRNQKISSDHFHTAGLYTLESLARKGSRIENKAERNVRKPIHAAEKNDPHETPDQARETSPLTIWQSLA